MFLCKKAWSFVKMGSSQSLPSAVDLVYRWHSEQNEKLIFDRGRAEVGQYLQAVDKIQQSATDNNQLKDIMSMAVARLNLEFRTVLTRQTDSVVGLNSTTDLSSMTDSTSYQYRYEDYVVSESPTAEVIRYLRSIAETLNSCGHLDDCVEAYRSVRKPFVDTIFKRLRLDELKAGDIKRFLWEEVKMKIQRWIAAAKVCTKILFDKEKQFAAQIFSGLGRTSSIHEECFLYIAKDAAVSLFSFAESVSLSHQSSERLETVLNLYEEMLSLTKDIDALFPLGAAKSIRDGTAATLSRLEDEIRRMLSDFENAVLRDLSTVSDDGGRVHPLTKHVMGYVNRIVNYRNILVRLIVSRPSMTIDGQHVLESELQDSRNRSPLNLHLVLIIAVLQLNLDSKSKMFKDPSLGFLFMMNNVKYIVQKIEESRELQEMIGADYIQKLNGNVEEAKTRYQVLTCDRLLDCLKDEGLYVSRCCTYQVSVSALRTRMMAFNRVFEEIRLLQSSWEVQDLRLLEELRGSMLEKLMPAYERFLETFRSHLQSGKQRTMCIQYSQPIDVKHSVKDLEAFVKTDLFAQRQQTPSSEVPVENFHPESN